MSKDRLLSDEELRDVVKNQGRYRVAPHVWATLPDDLVASLLELFNTQKIAHAESVIGEDEELGADGLRRSDGATMNNLRAEQRARITTDNSKEERR